MSKHTLGPWFFKKEDGFQKIQMKLVDRSIDIAIVYKGHALMNSPDEGEANAYLIAAAPEMLEAIEYAIEWNSDGDPAPEWMINLIKVAAKAKGIKDPTEY